MTGNCGAIDMGGRKKVAGEAEEGRRRERQWQILRGERPSEGKNGIIHRHAHAWHPLPLSSSSSLSSTSSPSVPPSSKFVAKVLVYSWNVGLFGDGAFSAQGSPLTQSLTHKRSHTLLTLPLPPLHPPAPQQAPGGKVNPAPPPATTTDQQIRGVISHNKRDRVKCSAEVSYFHSRMTYS